MMCLTIIVIKNTLDSIGFGAFCFFADFDKEKATSLANELGLTVGDNKTIATQCDRIFLGVKPQVMAEMLGDAIYPKTMDYSEANPYFNRPQYEIIARQLEDIPWVRFAMTTAMFGFSHLRMLPILALLWGRYSH